MCERVGDVERAGGSSNRDLRETWRECENDSTQVIHSVSFPPTSPHLLIAQSDKVHQCIKEPVSPTDL